MPSAKSGRLDLSCRRGADVADGDVDDHAFSLGEEDPRLADVEFELGRQPSRWSPRWAEAIRSVVTGGGSETAVADNTFPDPLQNGVAVGVGRLWSVMQWVSLGSNGHDGLAGQPAGGDPLRDRPARLPRSGRGGLGDDRIGLLARGLQAAETRAPRAVRRRQHRRQSNEA